jgi:transposase
LIVCHNPQLELRCRASREELLVATEQLLSELAQRIFKRAEKNKVYSDSEIGIRVGRVVNRYHVAKLFVTKIQDGRFLFQRDNEAIERESAIDGFYVIGTNVKVENRSGSDIVRDYKRLSDVEKSFRTIKTTLLNVRPIHHRLERRVRAHIFICMLSYYVVWHLRRVWSKNLFCNDNLDSDRAERNPVVTARPTGKVLAKKSRVKITKFKASEMSNDGETSVMEDRVESFQTLLSNLSTICLIDCQVSDGSGITFSNFTIPNKFQEALLKQVDNL